MAGDHTSRVIPFPGTEYRQDPPVLLEASGLVLERGGRALLNELSLTVRAGGITALLGPNGAGKSLFLRIAAGLVAPDHGSVALAPGTGAPGIVFQKPVLLSRTVSANLTHALRLARVPRRDRPGRMAELLVTAGLANRALAPARTLSGGEAQRLAIVRAMAARPRLLLMDEPTSHLDPAATGEVEDMARTAAADGVKVIFVTHDRAQAARLADDVAFLSDGRITEHGPAPEFFAGPQSREAAAYLIGKLPT